MHYFIERFQHVTIIEFGFKGWKRDSWAQEKQYVDKLVKQGKIEFLNLNLSLFNLIIFIQINHLNNLFYAG